MFLLVKDSIWWQAAVGVVFVMVIVHLLARPVEGVGIQVPGIIPPLVAAGISCSSRPTWQRGSPMSPGASGR